MSSTQFFKNHRSWEDWVGMLIGVLIGISPWPVALRYWHFVLVANVALLAALKLAGFEAERRGGFA